MQIGTNRSKAKAPSSSFDGTITLDENGEGQTVSDAVKFRFMFIFHE